MMRYTVNLTGDAEEDIVSIHDYLEENESLQPADRTALAIFTAIGTLAEMPNRGNFPKELAAMGAAGTREIHVQSYRIFYRIEEQAVFVFAVADGRRDMQGFLYRRLVR